MRVSKISRKTGETDIQLSLNLDEASRGVVNSGNGFLDHMLDLFQVHGGFRLDLTCKGDTNVDMHHSMEDIAKIADRILVMSKGRKYMFDTTERVFSEGAELEKIGLKVPQITKIMMLLKENGVNVNPAALTLEQGFHEVLNCLSGI